MSHRRMAANTDLAGLARVLYSLEYYWPAFRTSWSKRGRSATVSCQMRSAAISSGSAWAACGSATSIRKVAGGDPQPLDRELTHFGDIPGRLVCWSQRPDAQQRGVQGFEQLAGVHTGCASAAAGTSSVMTCT